MRSCAFTGLANRDEARGVLSTVLRERIAFQLEGAESFKLTIPIAFERVLRAIIPVSNWNGVPKWMRKKVESTFSGIAA